MTVKNTTKSPMQFGDVIIESGKKGMLPKPYDEKHPVIKAFLERGFLKKSDSKSTGAGKQGQESGKSSQDSPDSQGG